MTEQYTVTVEAVHNEEIFEENRSHAWTLSFVVEFQCGPKFTFVIEEPYLVDDKLRALAAGKDTYIQCYQGNGRGAVALRLGEMDFIAAPSGAGGDVSSTFTLPAAAVLPKLRDELKHVNSLYYGG
jgi:hypothetical protein